MSKLRLFFKRLWYLETDSEIFWRVCRENNIEVHRYRSDKKFNGQMKYKKAPKVRKLNP